MKDVEHCRSNAEPEADVADILFRISQQVEFFTYESVRYYKSVGLRIKRLVFWSNRKIPLTSYIVQSYFHFGAS